ncbi:hypothetical protein DDR33_15810 [Pararcticibacter amylolyticus]|uniref:Uncharacterized protein n=1 Tax=Pararcticibacter amylolyticus TaxID=2173175 RepID=A0A2U2PDS2_9SPHI|nr:hypothetical protein DDR33_15810 [Pararcticibacter amylolyticus]
MKTLLLLFLLTCNNLCITTISTDTVYICDSSGAKKYHLRQNCKGLQNCQQKIIKITLDQATRRGRTLCGYEK